jgi:transcriptional regulator with XRE-family HTH domain
MGQHLWTKTHASTLKVDQVNNSSERFKEVRKALGLTQQELSDKLFLSRNYIAKIEIGIKRPTARVLNSLEALLVHLGNKSNTEYNPPSVNSQLVNDEPIVTNTEVKAAIDVLRHWASKKRASQPIEIIKLRKKVEQLELEIEQLRTGTPKHPAIETANHVDTEIELSDSESGSDAHRNSNKA